MSYYIDTSAVVAALVVEPHTPRVMAWLAKQPTGTVFISEWTYPEVASALSLKLRTGGLTVERRAAAQAAWHQLRSASFHTLAVTPDHFAVATGYATQHDLNIRAGDALHLAVVAASGFKLVTLDATMAKAAPLLGIPVEPLD